jgi:hypothetical protein
MPVTLKAIRELRKELMAELADIKLLVRYTAESSAYKANVSYEQYKELFREGVKE